MIAVTLFVAASFFAFAFSGKAAASSLSLPPALPGSSALYFECMKERAVEEAEVFSTGGRQLSDLQKPCFAEVAEFYEPFPADKIDFRKYPSFDWYRKSKEVGILEAARLRHYVNCVASQLPERELAKISAEQVSRSLRQAEQACEDAWVLFSNYCFNWSSNTGISVATCHYQRRDWSRRALEKRIAEH